MRDTAAATRKIAGRKDDILRVARSLFVKKGVEGTSLDDIVARTGGSRRNIYNEFGNKEGLLSAVVDQIVSEIATEIERQVDDDAASTEPREWLLRLCHGFSRQMLDPHLIAVFRQFISQKNDQERVAMLWKSGPARFHRHLANWLRLQNDTGRLRVPDPERAAIFLPEMIKGKFQLELLTGRRDRIPPEELEDHISAAVDFFLAGLQPGQAPLAPG